MAVRPPPPNVRKGEPEGKFQAEWTAALAMARQFHTGPYFDVGVVVGGSPGGRRPPPPPQAFGWGRATDAPDSPFLFSVSKENLNGIYGLIFSFRITLQVVFFWESRFSLFLSWLKGQVRLLNVPIDLTTTDKNKWGQCALCMSE